MTEYHYLIGADDVKNASHRMQSVADELRQVVASFHEAVERLRQVLEEDRVERAELARGKE